MNVIVLVKICYIETLFSIEDVAKLKKFVQIKNKKNKKNCFTIAEIHSITAKRLYSRMCV